MGASELLSATSCPSLSPSPSPYPRSVISEQDFDFCDPRNLTVGSGASPNPPATAYQPSTNSRTSTPRKTSSTGLLTFLRQTTSSSSVPRDNALVPARTSSPLTTSLSSARTTSKTSRNSRIPSNSRPLASQAHLHQAARPRSRRRSETRRPRRSTATRTAPNSTTLSDHESTLCQ